MLLISKYSYSLCMIVPLTIPKYASSGEMSGCGGIIVTVNCLCNPDPGARSVEQSHLQELSTMDDDEARLPTFRPFTR